MIERSKGSKEEKGQSQYYKAAQGLGYLLEDLGVRTLNKLLNLN